MREIEKEEASKDTLAKHSDDNEELNGTLIPVTTKSFEPTRCRDRSSHVDIARGISIGLVVLLHSPLPAYVPEISTGLTLIRMPLFFFLAGLFLSTGISIKLFASAKFSTLMVPYLFTCSVTLMILLMLKSPHFLWIFKGMMYGTGKTIYWGPMWFLPQLFLALIVAHALTKQLSLETCSNAARIILLFGLISFGSWILDAFWMREVEIQGRTMVLPGLPMSIDLLPITVAIILSGFFLREKVLPLNPTLPQAAIAFILFCVVISLIDVKLDLNKRIAPEPILAVVGAASGVFLVLYISCLLRHVPRAARIFKLMGPASLLILIFHTPILEVCADLFTFAGIAPSLYTMGVAFMLSIAIPTAIRAPASNISLLRRAYAIKK